MTSGGKAVPGAMVTVFDEAKSRLWLTWNYRNSPAIKGTTFEEWCAVLDSDAARMSELMQPYDQPVATDFL